MSADPVPPREARRHCRRPRLLGFAILALSCSPPQVAPITKPETAPRRVSPEFAVLSLLPVGAALAEFNPYVVPKESIQSRVDTIALAPAKLPAHIHDQDHAHRILAPIATALGEKGYAVVPPSEYAAVWTATARQLGGVFDPLTGEAHQEKFKAAFDYTARELASRRGVDAVLFIEVIEGDLIPAGGFQVIGPGYVVAGEVPTWDGEPLGTGLQWHPQRILGNVLELTLVDLGKATMYHAWAPIHWTRVYVARGYEDNASGMLSPQSLEAAVVEILDPLVSRPGGP